MPADCIFCKIVARQIPATKVYEDEYVVAFNDIAPVAPVHVLVIPKQHVASIHDVNAEDSAMLGHIFAAIQKIASEQRIAESGYRVATNAGQDAGQVVFHLHFHIIGGVKLGRIG